jgi:hypothetical protein
VGSDTLILLIHSKMTKVSFWYVICCLGILVAVSCGLAFMSAFIQKPASRKENFQSNGIPKIVHYVFGFKKQTEEFNLVFAMSILSAVAVIKPDHIYFWYHYEPHGKWWDMVKPFLDLQKTDLPDKIGSKSLKQFAHKADIVRMEKLLEYGGIYLDMDTICVRPIDDMLGYSMVMGEEGDYGLCNAIMMANKDSAFLRKWWNNYEEVFNPDGWNEASVVYPRQLAKTETSIKVYSEDTFFKPSFNETEDIFVKATSQIPENLRILHLWESFSGKYYTFDSIESMRESQTLYGAIVRHLFKTTNLSSLIK